MELGRALIPAVSLVRTAASNGDKVSDLTDTSFDAKMIIRARQCAGKDKEFVKDVDRRSNKRHL